MISTQLEGKFNYQFTVLLTSESPVDSWFTIQALDEIYAVWPGVNKIRIAWTYFIFANAKKGD
jgi:hypothetical protein